MPPNEDLKLPSMFEMKRAETKTLNEGFRLLEETRNLFGFFRGFGEKHLKPLEELRFNEPFPSEAEKQRVMEDDARVDKVDEDLHTDLLRNDKTKTQQAMENLIALNRYGKFKHLMSNMSAPEESATAPFLTNVQMTLFTGRDKNKLPVLESIQILGEKYKTLARNIDYNGIGNARSQVDTRCLTALFEIGKVITAHQYQQAEYIRNQDPIVTKTISVQTGERLDEDDDEKEKEKDQPYKQEIPHATEEEEKIFDHIDIVRTLIPPSHPIEYDSDEIKTVIVQSPPTMFAAPFVAKMSNEKYDQCMTRFGRENQQQSLLECFERNDFITDEDRKTISNFVTYTKKYLIPNPRDILKTEPADIFGTLNLCTEKKIYDDIIENAKFPNIPPPESPAHKQFVKEYLEPFNGLLMTFQEFGKQLYGALTPIDVRKMDDFRSSLEMFGSPKKKANLPPKSIF